MNNLVSALAGSLLICLWTSLSSAQARAQAPVEITAVTSTTNGVRLTWTDPGPGQAYTVQFRASLTSGSWGAAPTRYRWPWPFTHWADLPGSPRNARYYRVLSQTVTAPDRGKLLGSSSRSSIPLNSLKRSFTNWGVASFAQPQFGTIARVFNYETADPYGLPVNASALLILPQGTNGPLPLLSVQHGTLAWRGESPTQPDSVDTWAVAWAQVFASQGYAVVVPDYLGLGSSPGYQAYLHARSEATCVVDALRAGRSLCASNNMTLNGQIFLTGYSQGGHVTMAAHRELEAAHSGEFVVTASAPCAAAYDLGGVMIEALLANPNYPGGPFFAMMLASYLPIYQLGDTLEELLAEPYRRTLPPTLDGTTYGLRHIAAVLPADAISILRPDLQADFRTNVHNPVRQAMLENNTYAWTPKAPLKMVHCQGDEIVIYANVEVAYQSFVNRGACCVSVADPGAPERLNHDDCIIPSLRETLGWFETFRK